MRNHLFFLIGAVFICLYWTNPAGCFSPKDENCIKLIYTIVPDTGSKFRATTKYCTWQNSSGNKEFYYFHKWPDRYWEVLTDPKGNPKTITYSRNNNFFNLDFDSANNQVNASGLWDQKKYHMSKAFEHDVSMETCLMALHLDFIKGQTYEFDLIHSTKLPEELDFKTMLYKVVGKTTVQVKAGNFRCVKLKLTLSNPIFRPFYQGFAYFTDDKNRFLVKAENMPKGHLMLLQSLQSLNSTQNKPKPLKRTEKNK